MKSEPKDTSVTIQDLDRESMRYIKSKGIILSGLPRKGNCSFLHPTSIYYPGCDRSRWIFFLRGVGAGLTHTDKFLIKKLRTARETGDLEAEIGEHPKQLDTGRVVESYFNLQHEYSSSIKLTDSDYLQIELVR